MAITEPEEKHMSYIKHLPIDYLQNLGQVQTRELPAIGADELDSVCELTPHDADICPDDPCPECIERLKDFAPVGSYCSNIECDDCQSEIRAEQRAFMEGL